MQVLLETHSATTAFNLSHAEEAAADQTTHPAQRHAAPGLLRAFDCRVHFSDVRQNLKSSGECTHALRVILSRVADQSLTLVMTNPLPELNLTLSVLLQTHRVRAEQ